MATMKQFSQPPAASSQAGAQRLLDVNTKFPESEPEGMGSALVPPAHWTEEETEVHHSPGWARQGLTQDRGVCVR